MIRMTKKFVAVRISESTKRKLDTLKEMCGLPMGKIVDNAIDQYQENIIRNLTEDNVKLGFQELLRKYKDTVYCGQIIAEAQKNGELQEK